MNIQDQINWIKKSELSVLSPVGSGWLCVFNS